MNPLIQKLLAPVSEAQPCGPDYSDDPRFDELETILKGKPEVEIGSVQRPAEPPEWGELNEKAAKFLGESKHLRVAVMFACSLLQTGGMPGFRDGLQLIKGSLEQYWPGIYPLLDPEDNNDPTQRLNNLLVLTAPRASVSGWLTIVDYLYAAEVCRPKGLPPITFDQILSVRALGPDAVERVKLAAVIREVDGAVIVGQQQVVQEALEAVKQIDQFLSTTLGAGNTFSFEVLETLLTEMSSALKPYLPGAPAESSETGGGTSGGTGGGAGTGGEIGGGTGAIAVRGSIRSRDDVVRVLASVCEYYEQVERSSPVPYLLRRAQKLARMDFVEAVQELNLATVDSLRPSMGSAIDASIPPSPPPQS